MARARTGSASRGGGSTRPTNRSGSRAPVYGPGGVRRMAHGGSISTGSSNNAPPTNQQMLYRRGRRVGGPAIGRNTSPGTRRAVGPVKKGK